LKAFLYEISCENISVTDATELLRMLQMIFYLQ